jgi:protein disulfide-isomerase A1
MKILTTLALLTSCLASVTVLDSNNIDSFLTNEVAMVEFYAPWCGHCKALEPEYTKAAEILEEKNSVAKMGKVDCTVETDLCGKWAIKGYPTIKIFRKGVHSDYEKGREASAIVEFLLKQTEPPVSELKSTEEYNTFLQNHKNYAVVGYFKGLDTEEAKEFSHVADSLFNDFSFGIVTDDDLIKNSKVESTPAIVIFRNFDTERVEFPENAPNDAYTAENIKVFVKANSIPLIGDIGIENYRDYISSPLRLAFIFYDNEESKAQVRSLLEPVAKKYKSRVNFVFIDAVRFGDHATTLALERQWPAIAIQNTETFAKFPYPQDKEITSEGVDKFVNDVLEGLIMGKVKSEPIPKTNDGPVKIVVSDQYNEIVLSGKDVLIKFLSPKCPHCINAAPAYEELAKKVASVETLVIAKMDATRNDIPPDQGFTVDGFPTWKFYKKGNEIIDYKGDRSVESFISFLKEHGALPDDFEAESTSKDEL